MSEEKVAIIGGTGDLGFGLALRWASAGVSVVIGSREAAKAEAAAAKVLARLGELSAKQQGCLGSVTGVENGQAAAQAAAVVLTVPFPAQMGILKSIRAALGSAKDGILQGRILVDATVPLAATVGGKPTRLLGVWQGSAAEQARELVPPGVPVLAAFHNASAGALEDLSLPLDCDILVCGDDAEAKKRFFPL